MNKLAIRLLTLAMLSLTLAAAPVVTAVYAAPDNDPPPPADKGKKKKSSEARPGIEQTAFADGYRAAYATIYDRHDYASAIAQLKALGRDDSAAVANLIGYSYRKLGDYKVSQIWYERALKADPNHVKTWQYYGLWQVEQGNRDQAQYHLNKIAQLTGTDKRGISLARRSAGKAAGHRTGLLSHDAFSRIERFNRRSSYEAAPVLFDLRLLLHQRLDFGPERLTRGVARIEHVAAGIDHELDPVRAGIGRQLVEQDLRGEIGRGEIEQPVPDQQFQLRIERENLPQLRNQLGRIWPRPKSQALFTLSLSSWYEPSGRQLSLRVVRSTAALVSGAISGSPEGSPK